MTSIFSTSDVRVMTYNLKNGGNLSHWEQRKQVLVETIRQQAPTILSTQEGYEFQLAYLRDELQHYEVLGEGREPILGDEYCAVMVDTRATVVHNVGTFWLSPTPGVPGSKMPGADLPRIATWVKMTVHDTPVLYINTHLTYLIEEIPGQMAVLVEQIKKLIDPSIETVITGDFNIGRQHPPMESLRALGFQDVWSLDSEIEGPIFTFPDWHVWDAARLNDVSEEERIDWVCIRPADGDTTPPLRVETIHTHTVEPVPSDHFPVVVTARTRS